MRIPWFSLDGADYRKVMMSENRQQGSVRNGPGEPRRVPRKPYAQPCLIEWGSLRDLTRGPISGLDDLPFDGGTTNE